MFDQSNSEKSPTMLPISLRTPEAPGGTDFKEIAKKMSLDVLEKILPVVADNSQLLEITEEESRELNRVANAWVDLANKLQELPRTKLSQGHTLANLQLNPKDIHVTTLNKAQSAPKKEKGPHDITPYEVKFGGSIIANDELGLPANATWSIHVGLNDRTGELAHADLFVETPQEIQRKAGMSEFEQIRERANLELNDEGNLGRHGIHVEIFDRPIHTSKDVQRQLLTPGAQIHVPQDQGLTNPSLEEETAKTLVEFVLERDFYGKSAGMTVKGNRRTALTYHFLKKIRIGQREFFVYGANMSKTDRRMLPSFRP